MPEGLAIELRPKKTIGYRFVRVLVHGLWWMMFRPTVTGTEHIPADGPVIIAPIHRSNIDFAFIVFMSPRKTFFMAKDTLWNVPVLRALISELGAFPVKRGTADRESMVFAQRVLEKDQALVLFPEGTRKEGLEVGELHDGAMFLASRTGAVVVPVGIGHTERAMPRGAKFPRPVKVRIVIGPPIAAPVVEGRVNRSQVTSATEGLREGLAAVYRESMR